MPARADELRGVLAAYKTVMDASWPDLHPGIAAASRRWASAGETELQAELDGYLRDADQQSRVRVFWKTGAGFRFAGANLHFARDAGFASPQELIGLDDFDKRLPWMVQAPKYRADDEEVFTTGQPKLDILERQKSSTGVIWVLAGKAPIRTGEGVIGILGLYEVLEGENARRVLAERSRRKPG